MDWRGKRPSRQACVAGRAAAADTRNSHELTGFQHVSQNRDEKHRRSRMQCIAHQISDTAWKIIRRCYGSACDRCM
jgi:hypothetical protein